MSWARAFGFIFVRRRNPSLAFPYLALIALCALLPLRGETILYVPTGPDADVSIRLTAPWSLNPRFGFAPVLVSIENRAKTERSWHVEFEAGMRNFSSGYLTSGQDIAVAAGQTREVWILVPLAEAGLNFGGGSIALARRMGSSFPAGGAKTVKVTDVPTGKKVTATTVMASGARFVTEIDVNVTTGVITTVTTPPSGPPRSNSREVPLPNGSEVTFTIDRGSGLVTPTTRILPGSTAPAVVHFVETGSASPSPSILGRASTSGGPGSASLNPMALSAEVSGPSVTPGAKLVFPGASSPNAMRPIAVSVALEPTMRATFSSLLSGAPNLSTVQPDQLPADWRVWSSFSGVVLTTDEYGSLDAARGAALRAWVSLGGQLYLTPVGVTAIDLRGAAADVEKIGAGAITKLTTSLDLGGESTSTTAAPDSSSSASTSPASAGVSSDAERRAASIQAEINARRVARGGKPSVALPAVSATARGPAFELSAKMQLFTGTPGLPNQEMLLLDKDGPLFEQVKDDDPDRAWLAAFLVLFAIVVGPLNLFWFAPAKRRHRLFLTTPLISLAASVILGVTILVQDGLGGSGMRRALVVLLPGENQAAVVQEQAASTGLLFRRSFALPDDVQLTSLPLDEPTYTSAQIAFARGSGRASGDWFRSRSRQAQLLQRVAPTRSRIERVGTAPDGAPIVQSSLGTPLRDFVLVGDAKQFWKIAELPAGKRVTLERGGIWLAEKGGLQVPGGTPRFKTVFDLATAELPGRWGALGGATELAPIATLDSIRWSDNDVLYVGTLENGAGAGAAARP